MWTKKNRTSSQDKNSVAIPEQSRRWLPYAMVILSPILFFLLLEGTLRIMGYGEDYSLFIPLEGQTDLMRINPKVGSRYYVDTRFQPEVSADLFKVTKDKSTIRIFAVGGSSAAGYPYLHNAAFTRILRNVLTQSYPEFSFEVINVAMTAVNSFTILDLMPEIIDADPDAILIYAGHNEFYGALGAGSTQNIGNSRLLINTYLSMIHSRFFQLIRNFISGIQKQNINPKTTLMHRMVEKQVIPLNSEVYLRGKENFSLNMEGIFAIAKDANVPVAISNLVSNIRDMRPFISITPSNTNDHEAIARLVQSIGVKKDKISLERLENELMAAIGKYPQWADLHFGLGKLYLKLNKKKEAIRHLEKAKDLDGLRFRATEEFNHIIHELAQRYQSIFVDTKTELESHSETGIIGNALILEHLHPNSRGYYHIASAFYRSCFVDNKLVPAIPVASSQYEYKNSVFVTALDSMTASIRLGILLNDWPFKKRNRPSFQAKNQVENLAIKLQKKQIGWEEAHFKTAQWYLKNNRREEAAAEFRALISETPYNSSPYIFLTQILLGDKQVDEATPYLQRAAVLKLEAKEAYSINTTLGLIFLNKGKDQKALEYFQAAYKIEPGDPRLLYNMIGANIRLGNRDEAKSMLDIYRTLNPGQDKIEYLEQLIK